jgi:hypothetical protein
MSFKPTSLFKTTKFALNVDIFLKVSKVVWNYKKITGKDKNPDR